VRELAVSEADRDTILGRGVDAMFREQKVPAKAAARSA
jgi:hypothetical protein